MKLILATTLLGAGTYTAAGDSTAYLDEAHADLQAGRADEALHKLRDVVQQSPQNDTAYNLLCRTYLTEEHWDEAIDSCEKAVQIRPSESDYHLWLGRAYGEKADRVSFVIAYSLGKKVRFEFEAAVQADPRNAAALSDLGEFYAVAPSIIGGGAEKAEDIARRLDSIDPARAHELRARIAEAQKDFGRVESEFKAAIAASPKPAKYWMNLASFYRRRQRWNDMVASVRNGVAVDKEPDASLPNGAWVLIRANREPQLAAQMLESYLASPRKTEEAPAFVAHRELGLLKKQLGDAEGAQREFAAAAELASGYKQATENANSGR